MHIIEVVENLFFATSPSSSSLMTSFGSLPSPFRGSEAVFCPHLLLHTATQNLSNELKKQKQLPIIL